MSVFTVFCIMKST